MEEVLLRFGHIGDQIFEELDSQTLLKCGFVGRDWNLFLDHGKVRPFRIIKAITNIDENYLTNRIKEINVETAKGLVTTIRNIYQGFPRRGNINPTSHMDIGNTPLHQAAKNGHLLLCELIIDNVDDKNPKYEGEKTPLHYAAKYGHLAICQLIIDNVDDKNPKDNVLSTPLHYAAVYGHFEICQLIIDNADDKNPKNNLEITPLHYAAENGHFAICKLIIGNVDDKNPKNFQKKTPLDLAKSYNKKHVYRLFQ